MPQYKILLVDDSPNVLKSLQRVFKEENYDVYTAENARKALEIMTGDSMDLVISDYNMPDISGIEFLNMVRLRHPNTIRMMLTGVTDFEVAKEAINKGEIYRFFSKPSDDFELKFSVKHALIMRDLEKENSKLKKDIMVKEDMLNLLEKQYPGITAKNKTKDGSFVIESE